MTSRRPWLVSRTERIVADQWITLRADECVTGAGHVVAPYYVLEFPEWVHVVAFDSDRGVLLVRQYRHGAARFLWELPAGSMNPTDASPQEAAARELLEETGHGEAALQLVSSLYANPANQTNRVHAFLATGARPISEPDRNPSEEIEPRWVTLPEIESLIREGEFGQALHVCSLLLALRAAGVSLPQSER
jgi:8-oxo-dGTP pyrophosphatase MutT (NUDIX family)